MNESKEQRKAVRFGIFRGLQFWLAQFYDFLTRFDKATWMNEGEHEFDTLAGFILHELERIPHTGDKFGWKGFHFEIVDMDGHRIDKVLVTISEEIRDEMD